MTNSIPIRHSNQCPICKSKKTAKAALCEGCTKLDQAKKYHRRTVQGVIDIFSESFRQLFMRAYDEAKTAQAVASCLESLHANLENRRDSQDTRNRRARLSRARYVFENMKPAKTHPQDDPPTAA